MKEDKIVAVSKAVMQILNQKGMAGMSHSAVARVSKVSRPWLYKYVGKTKKDLIDYSISHFGEIFSKLGGSVGAVQNKKEMIQYHETLSALMLDTFKKHPEVLSIYFKYLGTTSPLGKVIADIEEKKLKESSQALKKIYGRSDRQAMLIAEILLTLKIGLSFRFAQAGFRNGNSLEEINEAVQKILGAAVVEKS